MGVTCFTIAPGLPAREKPPSRYLPRVPLVKGSPVIRRLYLPARASTDRSSSTFFRRREDLRGMRPELVSAIGGASYSSSKLL